MGRAIGIDLGTTNSCVAIVENGVPRILAWPGGGKTIPSVFAIDKTGSRLVGDEAKAQATQNPENTVTASKRLIGRSFDSKAVEQMSQVFTYELIEGEDSEVLVKVANQVLTLEQVSAAILLRLKEHAQATLGEPANEAVITVPAYFNDRQRQAVRAAGRLAGLDVLRVLNEPTAAALAYGLGRELNQRVAIYDLGGGTFDISIIDIKDKVFEVVATGGDTFLGGVDFDDRVMQHLLKSFYLDHGVDLSYDRVAVARIRDACEQAKIRLSDVLRTTIDLPAIGVTDDGASINLHYDISRAELETLTQDLVERSVATCERILKDAGTDTRQVDELLLVGGQSRMPLVRRTIEAFLGRPPSEKVNPDEAVAMGAAIMAASLGGKRGNKSPQQPTGREVTLHDVLPMPIGLGKPDGSTHVLFAKNTPLPARLTRTLTTSKDEQNTLVLRMYQGDSNRTRDCEALGSFAFYNLRKAPKGMVRLEVLFHIDSEGILELSARDKDTGEGVASRIRLDGRESESESDPEHGEKGARRPPLPPPAPIHMPRKPTLSQEIPELRSEHITTADESVPEPTPPPPPTPAARRRRPEPEPEPAPPAVVSEPEPPRDINNLRSQVRRAAPEEVDQKQLAGGFIGWLKRLFRMA